MVQSSIDISQTFKKSSSCFFQLGNSSANHLTYCLSLCSGVLLCLFPNNQEPSMEGNTHTHTHTHTLVSIEGHTISFCLLIIFFSLVIKNNTTNKTKKEKNLTTKTYIQIQIKPHNTSSVPYNPWCFVLFCFEICMPCFSPKI